MVARPISRRISRNGSCKFTVQKSTPSPTRPPPAPGIAATMQVVPAAVTTACCCCCHCSKNYLLYAQITILLWHSTGLKFIVLILEIILLEGDHLLKHLVHVLALGHDLHVAFTKVTLLHTVPMVTSTSIMEGDSFWVTVFTPLSLPGFLKASTVPTPFRLSGREFQVLTTL